MEHPAWRLASSTNWRERHHLALRGSRRLSEDLLHQRTRPRRDLPRAPGGHFTAWASPDLARDRQVARDDGQHVVEVVRHIPPTSRADRLIFCRASCRRASKARPLLNLRRDAQGLRSRAMVDRRTTLPPASRRQTDPCGLAQLAPSAQAIASWHRPTPLRVAAGTPTSSTVRTARRWQCEGDAASSSCSPSPSMRRAARLRKVMRPWQSAGRRNPAWRRGWRSAHWDCAAARSRSVTSRTIMLAEGRPSASV